MAMQIAVEKNLSRVKRPPHHMLHMVINGVLPLRTLMPLPVQICAHQRTSIVADYDTVWILHRDDLEHKLVSQKSSRLLLGN